MAERPAVDASPLITLAHAGHLDLLQLAAPELVVPQPVADEIQRRGSGDPTTKALATIDWLQVVGPSQVAPEMRRGRFPSARHVLETMRRAGMYLSDQVLDRALKSVGE